MSGYPSIVLLIVAVVLTAATEKHEGRGLLNVVEVGKDRKLSDIKEIKNFTAMYADIEHGDKLIWFILELDPSAKIVSPGNFGAPALGLIRDNRTVAIIPLAVGNMDKKVKEMGLVMEWKTDVEFDESSQCAFSLNPNSEDYVTVILPFSASSATYVGIGKKSVEMTFTELRNKVIASRSNPRAQ
jgi:hypothetical protein